MPVSTAERGGVAAAGLDAGFGVYVHWPFCLSKCPYCDFNSHVRGSVDQSRWRAALLKEIDHYADQLAGRRVDSVFFGGGTPSLMPPETVAGVIDRIAARWPLADGVEITLEANPTSVEAARFAAVTAAGVNRISLGVQALDAAALRFLGRQHGVDEALAALELARRHADRVSFDLIYARPGQNLADWQAELGRALTLADGHLSLYQLTIEEGTAFHLAVARGVLTMPDDETCAELFEATQAMCAAAGLPAYEISNHAAPGQECRHNLIYWRGGEYAGIGPGAHGRIRRGGDWRATAQARRPEDWLSTVERAGHDTETDTAIDADTRAEERLMMGLRLADGVDLARFAADVGRELRDWVGTRSLQTLLEDGYLALDERRLSATPKGRQVLNAVLTRLLA